MIRKLTIIASCVILLAIAPLASGWSVFAYYGLKPVGRIGPDPTHNVAIAGGPHGFPYSINGTAEFLGTANQNANYFSGLPEDGLVLNWAINTTSGLYTASWEIDVGLTYCTQVGCTSVWVGDGDDAVLTGFWVNKYP